MFYNSMFIPLQPVQSSIKYILSAHKKNCCSAYIYDFQDIEIYKVGVKTNHFCYWKYKYAAQVVSLFFLGVIP